MCLLALHRRAASRARIPRDPQQTSLHRVVRQHLQTFLGRRSEAGEPMPGFVVDELRGYLRCGVLAHGALRFACEHCGEDRLVGLSCKGRGFCPRCLGRRMTEMARHWVSAVLPRVRVRPRARRARLASLTLRALSARRGALAPIRAAGAAGLPP